MKTKYGPFAPRPYSKSVYQKWPGEKFSSSTCCICSTQLSHLTRAPFSKHSPSTAPWAAEAWTKMPFVNAKCHEGTTLVFSSPAHSPAFQLIINKRIWTNSLRGQGSCNTSLLYSWARILNGVFQVLQEKHLTERTYLKWGLKYPPSDLLLKKPWN